MDLKLGFLLLVVCIYESTGTTLDEASRSDFSLIMTDVGQNYGEATLTVSLRTSIKLGIRSCKDSRLVLQAVHSDGSIDNTMIYFGTSTNDNIMVKNMATDETLISVTQDTGVLNCNYFKFFWLTWKEGKLSFGTGGTSNTNIGTNIVFTLQPVDMLWNDITLVEFLSGDENATQWLLPEDQGENLVISTQTLTPLNKFWKKLYYEPDFVTFEAKSKDDIRIWLSNIFEYRLYELYVRKDPSGGANFGVGMNKLNSPVGPNPTFTEAALLDENFFKEFWISWRDGTIMMGAGLVKGRRTLFQWTDPDFVPVYVLSVGSGAEFPATFVFLETTENIYVFASNPSKPGGGTLYDGSMVIPRTQKTFFSVKACANARVALGSQPLDFGGDEPYFIDIGVNNTETHITKGFGPPSAVQSTPNILDCNIPMGFWLSWSNNQIKIGRGINIGADTILSYDSPTPGELDIFQTVGFYNDHINGAIFQVFDNSGDQAFLQTYDNLLDQNTWVTVENEFFRAFTLQACSDAYISVSEVPGDVIEYQLIMGTGGNPNQLAATKLGEGVVLNITVEGGLLSCDEPREFWLSWMEGLFRFGRGHHINEDIILLDYDETPFPINALSVSTGNKQSGLWQFEMDSGDEFITSTAHILPTVLRLNSDVTGFYVRMKGMNASVILSDSTAQGAGGYTFTFGDGDTAKFTLKNPDGGLIAQGTLRTPIQPVYLTDFWISWADGSLNAGYGRLINLNPILEQPIQASGFNPATVQFSGPGEFYSHSEIGSETVFTTPANPHIVYSNLWYKLRRRTTLLFAVQACSSASLLLSPVEYDISVASTYRIQLGGKDNNVVQIYAGSKIASTYVPNLLDCNSERIFWVTWTNRVLNVGSGNIVGENVILNIADMPKTIPVNAVSFGIGAMQSATWRVSNNQEPLSGSISGSGRPFSGPVTGMILAVLLCLNL